MMLSQLVTINSCEKDDEVEDKEKLEGGVTDLAHDVPSSSLLGKL